MKTPPNIKLKVIEPAFDAKPFIKTERNLCSLEYPGVYDKREMVIDSIIRYRPDASVIIPYTRIMGVVYVWLRSAIRPAAAIRHNEDPEFEYDGNLWELPAGIIDEGETPQEAAQRECEEEAGFDYPIEDFRHVATILSIPALIAERLYFYMVQVDNSKQGNPSLDGSALEEGGELICVPLSSLLEEASSGTGIPDMKTNLGLRMLKDKLTGQCDELD